MLVGFVCVGVRFRQVVVRLLTCKKAFISEGCNTAINIIKTEGGEAVLFLTKRCAHKGLTVPDCLDIFYFSLIAIHEWAEEHVLSV